MGCKLESMDNLVCAFLSGEIDHHSAGELRRKIDSEAQQRQPKILVMDFGGVTFMDSSGIGLVMGRYKLMQSMGGQVVIQNPSAPIRKVMRMAGLDRLAVIRDRQLTGNAPGEDGRKGSDKDEGAE